MLAEWAGLPVLVRWQLELPMYDFKNSFSSGLTAFIEQNMFFPETYNALIISEPDFTVCYISISDMYPRPPRKHP